MFTVVQCSTEAADLCLKSEALAREPTRLISICKAAMERLSPVTTSVLQKTSLGLKHTKALLLTTVCERYLLKVGKKTKSNWSYLILETA